MVARKDPVLAARHTRYRGCVDKVFPGLRARQIQVALGNGVVVTSGALIALEYTQLNRLPRAGRRHRFTCARGSGNTIINFRIIAARAATKNK